MARKLSKSPPSDLLGRLEAARFAVGAEDFDGALRYLLAAWAETHAPEIAAEIERVSARIDRRPLGRATLEKMDDRWRAIAAKVDPADLQRLLGALASGTVAQAVRRVEALEQFPDDPRIAWGLARFIASPPYSVGVMFEKLIVCAGRSIERSAEPRVLEILASQAGHPEVARVIEATKSALAGRPMKPFDAPAAERLAALHDALDKACSGDELLAAIYAAPRDDTARAVYADWLLEHGDPHGELINLQLSADRSEHAVKRERELVARLEVKLAGPLAGVTNGNRVIRRGFIEAVTLNPTNSRSMIAARSAPQWQTVEDITIDNMCGHYVAKDTFDAPMFRNLRMLHNAPFAIGLYLAHEAPSPLALELLGLGAELDDVAPIEATDALIALFESPGHLATLTGVELGRISPELFARLAATTLGTKLRSFGVKVAPPELPRWLRVMTPTQILSFHARPWIPQATRSSPAAAWDLELEPVWSQPEAYDQLVEAMHDVPRERIRSLTTRAWHNSYQDKLERDFGWLGVHFVD
jgi:uncharacterized protein (TIGR02996 family)